LTVAPDLAVAEAAAAPAGNAPAAKPTPARAKSATRDRVLAVSLELFNERGIDRVTTAEIAEAASINEGNLYYYFQKKEQLALALFEYFAAAALATADQALGDPAAPETYAAYNRGWFALMWDYRFFYRDGGALRAVAPALRERLTELTRRGQASVRRVFGLMRAHGLMRATDEEVEALIANIWIVSSYWMDFRHGGGGTITPADLEWGQRQLDFLCRPYLVGR
jgi:AcrR family transcriptional regulator